MSDQALRAGLLEWRADVDAANLDHGWMIIERIDKLLALTPSVQAELSAARALIAEGLQHEKALIAVHPNCTCDGLAGCEDWCARAPVAAAEEQADAWFRANLSTLLTRYSQALDECDKLCAERDAATALLIASTADLTAARAEISSLRTAQSLQQAWSDHREGAKADVARLLGLPHRASIHQLVAAIREVVQERDRLRAAAVCARSEAQEAVAERDARANAEPTYAELRAAVCEWIASSDAPARSGDRGEASVWLARNCDAERALRAVVGCPLPHSELPSVVARAELLETEVIDLRRQLRRLEELTELTEQHDVYRDRCAQLAGRIAHYERDVAAAARALRLPAGSAIATPVQETVARLLVTRAALRSLILRIRKVGGYATPEEQDVLREAELVVNGGV